MTDINKEQVKSDILNGQKSVEETLKQVQADVKKSDTELREDVKSLANSIIEISKSMKEVAEEVKKTPVQPMKLDNNEMQVSLKASDESEVIKEVNFFSNEMLRGNLEGKQYDFFANDKFKNILEKALKEKCFNSSVREKIRQEIKNSFDEIKQLGPNAKKIPVLNFLKKDAGDVYRSSVGADGGYMMKPATVKESLGNLWDKLNPKMRDVANVRAIDSASLDSYSRMEGTEALWTGEEGKKDNQGKMGYAPVNIRVGSLTKTSQITRVALEDSMLDFATEIRNDFQEQFAKAQEKAFFIGNGLLDKPKGLMTYNYSTDLDNEKYKIGEFKAQSMKKSTLTPAILIDFILSTVAEMEEDVENKTIFLNPITYTKIITAKDNQGRFLADSLMPREINGIKTLAGCPVITSKYINSFFNRDGTSVADVKGAFIGDIAQTYTIVDRIDLVTWIEAIMDPTYVTYHARQRVGAGADVFNKGRYLITDNT